MAKTTTSDARVADLELLRGSLLVTLGEVTGRDVAPVARELRAVVRELDEVRRSRPSEGSLTDDLSKRRAARVSVPKGGVEAAVGE